MVPAASPVLGCYINLTAHPADKGAQGGSLHAGRYDQIISCMTLIFKQHLQPPRFEVRRDENFGRNRNALPLA